MPVFHEGELKLQQRTGESDIAVRNGGVIADTILAGALPFLTQQPMVVLGSLDAGGQPWASILFGEPGFMSAPDPCHVDFDLTCAHVDGDDPLWANVTDNGRVGALAIDLGSRRRLRVNGRVAAEGESRFVLNVEESYPNCPKYIQRRHLRVGAGGAADAGEAARGERLGTDQVALIGTADTFFVASAHAERGVDASHRGGVSGFVQVLDEGTLRIPDYAGNSMFNTLGNLALDPRAGLLFLDFEGGRSLQVVGRAEIQFDEADPEGRSGGTGRFWNLRVEGWRTSTLPVEARWEFLDASPFNPPGA